MTRTFSKIFGLGGMRLGWCYAPTEIIDVLSRVRPPFNVNYLATEAGVAALNEPDWVEKSRTHNSTERRRLADRLRQSGLNIYPSSGNFLLVDFGRPARAEAADAHLRQSGIIVRAMKSYNLAHCLRITIGTAEECNRVAEALSVFCHD